MMAAGALAMFVGLCFLPAILGEHSDPELLAGAACAFSVGALILAAGVFLKARGLPTAPQSGDSGKEAANPGRRVRGGCDLCGSEVPAIHCKVHQLHLCGTCLAEHYDVRSCVYTPTTRNATHKNRKTMAATRGA
jgi:hypothetical protein